MSNGETGTAISTRTQYSAEELKEMYKGMEENTDACERLISRLVLSQPTTPMVAKGTPGYRGGLWLDSQTDEILSDSCKPAWMIDKGISADTLAISDNCCIVSIFKLPSEFIKWKPMPKKGDPLEPGPRFHWKETDRNLPQVREGIWPKQGGTWGMKPEQQNISPPVTENMNFYILVIDPLTKMPKGPPIVLTFARTSYDAGKSLATSIDGHRMNMLPVWGRVYYLTSFAKPHAETNGTFFIANVVRGPETIKKLPETYDILDSICRPIQLAFTNQDTGRDTQLALLNMIHTDDGVSESSMAGSGSGTVNSTASKASSEAEDPFSSDAPNPAASGSEVKVEENQEVKTF